MEPETKPLRRRQDKDTSDQKGKEWKGGIEMHTMQRFIDNWGNIEIEWWRCMGSCGIGTTLSQLWIEQNEHFEAPDCRTYGSCNIPPVLPVDLLLAIPLPLLRILLRIGFARKWHHNAVTALGSFLTTGSQCSWATATTVHLHFGHTSTSISPHKSSTPTFHTPPHHYSHFHPRKPILPTVNGWI